MELKGIGMKDWLKWLGCEDMGLGWRGRNGYVWQVNKEEVDDMELWSCFKNILMQFSNACHVPKVD